MPTPVLATKLYIPLTQAQLVIRPRLIEQMNKGFASGHKLTIISAPAGFGKTTLVSEWISNRERPAAWLSLDEGDNDLVRFLTYLVAALQRLALSEVEGIVPDIGAGVLGMLQSPPPLPIESILTALLNEITAIQEGFVLVLDDFHVIDSKPIESALTFLLKHQPSQMHLVIVTREDPDLPLAQLRARGQLTELRVSDLRFTPSEAGEFTNEVMGLNLTTNDIAALEARTEGWIAGLQLAALALQGQISLQGHKDPSGFITSFTGSHRFVMDYLLEEVLQQQPEHVQDFLLRTSILDRLCGPLCDAVLADPDACSHETLEYIERANLFLIPLDNERRWYRYHHLFADLLRHRLQQRSTSASVDSGREVPELHRRASLWYEENGLELEAFQHAAASADIELTKRIIEGGGIPLYFRGTVVPILRWLESLPKTALDANPSLWVMSASAQLLTDHTLVEQKLRAAESALQRAEPDDDIRDLVGRIASMRATLAVIQHDAETIIAQSRRALEFLHTDNLHLRTAATWSLGHAYQLQGDRVAASQAFNHVISISKSLGNSVYTMAALINLGQVQESDNQLSLATTTYNRVLEMAGDPPQPMTCEAYLGLARIYYQWNDLDAAQEYGLQCLLQTRQIAMENVDTLASCNVLLAHLKLVQGDVPGAVAGLATAEEFVRQHGFQFRMADVAGEQVLLMLHQGNLVKAAHLAETHHLPLSLARVYLAQGNPSAALNLLETLSQQAEARSWQDEKLKVTVLQALALHAKGEKDQALQLLGDALSLAEPGGFIRIFVDEGVPMLVLLRESAKHGTSSKYIHQLIAAFGNTEAKTSAHQSLVEPLSERELEVLKLLSTEMNGPEIARGLMVSLNTMRTHTKNIYSKLGVNNRRAAARRAQELNLL